MADVEIFGLQPRGHHLVSLLFHAANGVLVYLLLVRLTRSQLASLITAALFALHPMQVEAVEWASSRKDVLSAFFGFLALLAYARHATRHAQSAPPSRPASVFHHLSSIWYWMAMGCFALGLMTKPMLVTLPFVLLLLDYWPLQRWSRVESPESRGGLSAAPDGAVRHSVLASPLSTFGWLLWEKVPFFALAMVSTAVGYGTLKAEKALGAPASGLCDRFSQVLIGYQHYLAKIIWPAGLNLCQAALRHSIKRLVYVSSSEVYGTAQIVPMDEMHPREPTTVYGASKLAGEKYALAYHKTYGLPSMAVIPFNTYGPREHLEGPYGEVIPKFTLRVLSGKPPVIFGDGSQTRDFTYVGDTVRGSLMASASDSMIGETVNIARGEEASVLDLAQKICTLLGRGALQPVFEKSRPGDVMRHLANVRKAERLFRFRAETSLVAGLELYLSWFTGQGYDIERLASEDIIFNWKGRG